MSSSDAALLQEIQRLSGAINRHKSGISSRSSGTRDLVINGVAFESSRRKLTRKDLIANRANTSYRLPRAATASPTAATRPPDQCVRESGGNTSTRVNKARFSKPRRKRLGGRNNMVLDNVKGTRTGRVSKRRKMDKQCRFFTMTGVCQRGLTCPYQHDAEKIAICPLFLTHSCPNSADSCHLSHNPTPARVPFCHHFSNQGRCTRENCLYPHVRVGPRLGVCRDFAVLGYCDKGIDCEQQHVRECPDFAEKGVCPNPKCKLPHVIRANRRRQLLPSVPQIQLQHQGAQHVSSDQETSVSEKEDHISPVGVQDVSHTVEPGAAEEYISLTFEESDEEDDEEGDGEEDENDDRDERSENQMDEDFMD